ncbi:MAG TPA: serine/threonine-protein kinase [Chitinispirillaceae bacterium]|nr:serine/threonine-protein kinase [Chitinispirillaceae bacterium]
MSSQDNSRLSGSEDAFSDIPDFETKPHDTGTGYKKVTGAAFIQTKDREAKAGKSGNTGGMVVPETGTKVFIGKKITDTNEINRLQKMKDTTLNDISIDTDFEGTEKTDENKPLKLSETTIASFELSNNGKSSQVQQPLITEEEMPDIAVQSSDNIPLPAAKREKILQSNISLDINPGEYQQKLPSGNEQIQLGSGVITGVLGSGGMAKVYRTWNEKLEVYRAVKILIPTSQKITWTRFLTEAKISAKLRHPNIVEVHTIGDWHGIPFIEMDIVEGETLSSMISRYRALPSMLVSAIAVQVARALAYAHCLEIVIYGKTYKGLIHRDLKPSNIMISKNGIVKLMDFGVARPVETGLHTIDTENIVGTVHYFSPEQISGYPIDPLSDIYSFGAVMYEMLCGSNPFPQTTMIQLIRAKEKNQFVRLEDYEKPIDPRLASVAQVCLRTDKNGRFQSAAELCRHLEELHSLYNKGTPEEVVRAFLLDPESIYREADALLLSREAPQIREQSSQTDPVIELDTQIIENYTDAADEELTNKIVESDSEYLHARKRRNILVAVLIILSILSLAAGIIVFGNNIWFSSDFWSGPEGIFKGVSDDHR